MNLFGLMLKVKSVQYNDLGLSQRMQVNFLTLAKRVFI